MRETGLRPRRIARKDQRHVDALAVPRRRTSRAAAAARPPPRGRARRRRRAGLARGRGHRQTTSRSSSSDAARALSTRKNPSSTRPVDDQPPLRAHRSPTPSRRRADRAMLPAPPAGGSVQPQRHRATAAHRPRARDRGAACGRAPRNRPPLPSGEREPRIEAAHRETPAGRPFYRRARSALIRCCRTTRPPATCIPSRRRPRRRRARRLARAARRRAAPPGPRGRAARRSSRAPRRS